MQFESTFTPSSIVADIVHGAGANAMEAAYLNALSMLHDPAINMLVSSENGITYFIAAPAKDFRSEVLPGQGQELHSPLAAALPGNPGHQGDAGYLAPCQGGWAVVVRRGSMLHSTTGPEELCRSFVREMDVPEVVLDAEFTAPWVSFNLMREKQAARMNLSAVAGALGVAALAAVVWILSTVFAGPAADPQVLETERLQAQNLARGELAHGLVNPAMATLADFQELALLVSAAEGYLVSYALDGNKLTWTASLPAYTTSERIQALGAGLATRTEGDRIIVEREAAQ